MTNQINKLIKLFAIGCLSVVSVTDLFSQVIGDESRDIPVITDIVTIRHISHVTIESDGDLVDDEMTQLFQIWQQSLNGQVQRDDEPEVEPITTYEIESNDTEAEALPTDTYIYGETTENDMSLIESLTDEIEFLAYPNPAKDLLNIRFEDDGYFEISLFNVVGKLELYYQAFEQQSHILDVSGLPIGMYLLQISDGTDVKTKRVNVVR